MTDNKTNPYGSAAAQATAMHDVLKQIVPTKDQLQKIAIRNYVKTVKYTDWNLDMPYCEILSCIVGDRDTLLHLLRQHQDIGWADLAEIVSCIDDLRITEPFYPRYLELCSAILHNTDKLVSPERLMRDALMNNLLGVLLQTEQASIHQPTFVNEHTPENFALKRMTHTWALGMMACGKNPGLTPGMAQPYFMPPAPTPQWYNNGSAIGRMSPTPMDGYPWMPAGMTQPYGTPHPHMFTPFRTKFGEVLSDIDRTLGRPCSKPSFADHVSWEELCNSTNPEYYSVRSSIQNFVNKFTSEVVSYFTTSSISIDKIGDTYALWFLSALAGASAYGWHGAGLKTQYRFLHKQTLQELQLDYSQVPEIKQLTPHKMKELYQHLHQAANLSCEAEGLQVSFTVTAAVIPTMNGRQATVAGFGNEQREVIVNGMPNTLADILGHLADKGVLGSKVDPNEIKLLAANQLTWGELPDELRQIIRQKARTMPVDVFNSYFEEPLSLRQIKEEHIHWLIACDVDDTPAEWRDGQLMIWQFVSAESPEHVERPLVPDRPLRRYEIPAGEVEKLRVYNIETMFNTVQLEYGIKDVSSIAVRLGFKPKKETPVEPEQPAEGDVEKPMHGEAGVTAPTGNRALHTGNPRMNPARSSTPEIREYNQAIMALDILIGKEARKGPLADTSELVCWDNLDSEVICDAIRQHVRRFREQERMYWSSCNFSVGTFVLRYVPWFLSALCEVCGCEEVECTVSHPSAGKVAFLFHPNLTSVAQLLELIAAQHEKAKLDPKIQGYYWFRLVEPVAVSNNTPRVLLEEFNKETVAYKAAEQRLVTKLMKVVSKDLGSYRTTSWEELVKWMDKEPNSIVTSIRNFVKKYRSQELNFIEAYDNHYQLHLNRFTPWLVAAMCESNDCSEVDIRLTRLDDNGDIVPDWERAWTVDISTLIVADLERVIINSAQAGDVPLDNLALSFHIYN